MQQHSQTAILSSIFVTLQSRTSAGFTTHIGKFKAQSHFKGSALVDLLASDIVGRRPPELHSTSRGQKSP
jgi:hypothetical protein